MNSTKRKQKKAWAVLILHENGIVESTKNIFVGKYQTNPYELNPNHLIGVAQQTQ